MLSNLCRILEQFKVQGTQKLGTDEELTQLCRELGMTWRERLLTPIVTLRLFFLQILHGNVGADALPHLAGFSFSNSVWCMARQRLPLELLQRLLSYVTRRLLLAGPLANADRWLGHRVLIADASGFSLPDTPPLQKHFGQVPNQKPGCGFPVAFCLLLMHYGSGVIQRLLPAPLRTHEASMLPQTHPELAPGDVVVGDSSFGNFVQLALLAERGVYGLFRLAHRIVDFTPHRPHSVPGQRRTGAPCSRWRKQLGQLDQIVDWYKPSHRPPWMTPQEWERLPEVLTVRELRYRITRCGFRVREVTLVTTLLDAERYSLNTLADLYRQRWTIETNLRHLKIAMKMDTLHSQTVEGVHKELLMFCLVYNLVRLVMGEAAQTQHVPITHISFLDALRWLLYTPDLTHPERLVTIYLRPQRHEPRVVKRRSKHFPLLTRPRDELRKALLLNQLLTK
jgi:Transposase DDE domain